jgi:hypothetical protein
MSNQVSLEDVERMAEQLPAQDRLRLIAHICEQLSENGGDELGNGHTESERLRRVDAWLAECDAVAESIEGEFDSAEDLRRIRHERARRL